MNMRQSLIWSVLRIVRDRQVAEDLTQETYIRVKKVADQGRVDHAEALIQRTARNLALDHLRRTGTRSKVETQGIAPGMIEQVAQDVPSIEDAIIERQRFGHMAQALASLPRRVQAVMILSRVDGWSNRRIAEYLGVSERTVFTDLKMALGHCRDAVARFEKE
ncbi:RNA polymerase sigma factor [Celeribacter sp. ULVN23_4]